MKRGDEDLARPFRDATGAASVEPILGQALVRRRLRAAWRLSRSVLHVLHGVAIVLLRFRALDASQRHARIGWWANRVLHLMGITLQVKGVLHEGATLLVANHVSWLDVHALHAVAPHARFVSKADVKSWPLVAQLADAAGTLYLERERKRDALRVLQLVAQALASGEAVAVFPEGTTSDGRALLPFHANLLQAAITTGTPVQPVALRFSDVERRFSAAVEFVGRTTLVQSLWSVACAEGLVAHVSLLAPWPGANADRRVLAQTLSEAIASEISG